MSWYKEGVVTLTNGSKTVTGVGTNWVDNVLPASIFITPTGMYEVEDVVSDTSLVLADPYAGPTASGLAYKIIPTQGFVPALAKKVGTMLASVGQVKDAYEAGDLAGTDALGDKASLTELAADTGPALIGYDGGTMQDIADYAKPMQSYAALRVYVGRAKGVRITTPGIAGTFERDLIDATSADNGGTIIVDALGRRWKRLLTGAATFRMFEAAVNGLTETAARVQAAANWARDAGALLEAQPSDRFLIGSTVTLSFPARIAMNGARFITAPSFTADGDGHAVKIRSVGNKAEGGSMHVGLQGPYGGDGYSAPPNLAIGSYNSLDGISIDGTAAQISNADIRIWVEGFRDNLSFVGANWYLVRLLSPHNGKAWRRGWNFSRTTNAGENLSFFGGVTFNCVNSAGTALAFYENGSANVDASIYGMSMDYCDSFMDVASGVWKLYGCHPENNNNNPQFVARYTSGKTRTRFEFHGTTPLPGPGGSGLIAPEVAGGRPCMVGLYDSVSVLWNGQIGQYGKNNTELVKQIQGTSLGVKFAGWTDLQTPGTPMPYAPNNALYNGDWATGTTAGWTVNSSSGTTIVVGATAGRNGTPALEITGTAGNTASVHQTRAVSPGDTWLVGGWVAASALSSGAARIRIQMYAADGTTAVYDDSTRCGAVTADAGYTQLGSSFLVPKGAATMRVTCYSQNAIGTVRFDDMYAVQIN